MRIRSDFFGLLFLTLFPVAACDARDAGRTDHLSSVRDSAGVEIVDVGPPLWQAGGGWTLSARPTLDIGSLDGEEPYQLYRVGDAIRLPSGSLVIANRGTQELRWYGGDGLFVRSAGGSGQGPGEFDSLFSLRVSGSTIWAHDFRLARMTAFDTAGGVLRTVVLDRDASLPIEVWPVSSGFIAHIMGTDFDITADLSYHRRTASYVRYADDGSVADSIETLPGLEFIISGGPAGGNTFVSTSTSPLIGHTSQQTVVGDRLVVGTTDRFEIRVFGPDGQLERIIRDPSRDLPVSEAEWAAVLDEAMADAETPARRRTVQTIAELRPAPEIRPAFGRFVGDRLGYLWIEPYRPVSGQPVPWLVVDVANGVLMGTIDLPEQFRPTDIGRDHVLGVMRDSLDVEHVRLYGLTRGAG